MRLLIDPAGGLAGDMFSAALLDLGVPFSAISAPMLHAARRLGHARIQAGESPDGSRILKISLKSKSPHLEQKQGEEILRETFARFALSEIYREIGRKIFRILIGAEKTAHREHRIEMKGHHHEQTMLHEAQDILIDILGASFGLQYLDVKPPVIQLNPVALGGGHIVFSHGRFAVPAPATRTIIREHKLWTVTGPVDFELFTPTGAAILAALAPLPQPRNEREFRITRLGKSRGSRPLEIPPLRLSLAED